MAPGAGNSVEVEKLHSLSQTGKISSPCHIIESDYKPLQELLRSLKIAIKRTGHGTKAVKHEVHVFFYKKPVYKQPSTRHAKN